MKSYKIAVIPGDKVVEVVKSSIEVLNKLQKGKNFQNLSLMSLIEF